MSLIQYFKATPEIIVTYLAAGGFFYAAAQQGVNLSDSGDLKLLGASALFAIGSAIYGRKNLKKYKTTAEFIRVLGLEHVVTHLSRDSLHVERIARETGQEEQLKSVLEELAIHPAYDSL